MVECFIKPNSNNKLKLEIFCFYYHRSFLQMLNELYNYSPPVFFRFFIFIHLNFL